MENIRLQNDIAYYNQKVFSKEELIELIIKFINDGYLFLEMAVILNVNEIVLHKTLYLLKVKNTRLFDPKRYEASLKRYQETLDLGETTIWQRFQNLENMGYNLAKYSKNSFVKKYYHYQQVAQMVRDFNESLSVEDIARKYKCALSTVTSNFLNLKKMPNIRFFLTAEELLKFLNLRQEQIKKERKEITTKNRIVINAKNICYQTPISKNDLKKKEQLIKNGNFWLHLILEFQLSLRDVKKLMGFENEQFLYHQLLSLAKHLDCSNAILCCITTNFENETKLRNALKFAKDYLNVSKKLASKSFNNALEEKYFSRQKEKMDSMLLDKEYQNLRQENKPFYKLTADEKLIVLKYRIKYAASYQSLGYKRDAILPFVPPEYQESMERVDTFNQGITDPRLILKKKADY